MTCPKTCAKARNITITQGLLDAEAAEDFRSIGYTERLLKRRITKGKDVALVAVSNNAMREAGIPDAPFLKCACDFHYEVTESGSHLHYIDTFRCRRKELWMAERRCTVGDEYRKRGETDPETIFLDLFRRVHAGEWVGQQHGSIIYLQEAAEIAGVGKGAFAGWGIGRKLIAAKKIGLDGAIMIPYREPEPEIADHLRRPLSAWGSDASDDPALVWVAKLDDRFLCEVQRLRNTSRRGVLCIFDHAESDRLLGWREVGLSYGAEFGPDVGDVALWQGMATAHIDTYVYKKALPDEMRSLLLTAPQKEDD